MTVREAGTPGRDGGEADERAARAFEQLPVASVATVGEGEDQRVVAANAAYRAMFGRPDLVGMTLREAFPEALGQQVLETVDRIYTTGVAETRRAWRFHMDVDGSGELTELFLDFAGIAVRDGSGVVTGTLFVATDVTSEIRERRRAETAAAEAQERYMEALDVVTALQSALLPDELPLVPGLDVAAHYLLAGGDSAAGGDWFDAVVRPDGRVALVVGDVVGHGVAASAVMGQLRTVLHEHLLGVEPLADALAALDRFAGRTAGARAATVCVVELDPETGDVCYCTAGHPVPLLVPAQGPSRFLDPSGAGPLATGSGLALAAATLEPDDLLLLYTDGILERRGVPLARATVELSQIVTDAAQNRGLVRGASHRATERACGIGLELLTRISGPADDITLLATQRTIRIAPLALRLPVGPQVVARVRVALADWLGAIEVRPADEIAVQHAVGELVTNAVEHAFVEAAGPGWIEVHADVDREGTLSCVVRDDGRWRQVDAAGTSRGRGLAMVTGFSDDVDVESGPTGTVVTMRQRLTRTARLLTEQQLRLGGAAATPATGTAYGMTEDASGLISLQGSVDLVSVGLLRRDLERATRGGTRPVTVDLSGLTLLGSVGVQTLWDLHRRGGLELRAAPGTPAQQVLDIVRLPYAAHDVLVPDGQA